MSRDLKVNLSAKLLTAIEDGKPLKSVANSSTVARYVRRFVAQGWATKVNGPWPRKYELTDAGQAARRALSSGKAVGAP